MTYPCSRKLADNKQVGCSLQPRQLREIISYNILWLTGCYQEEDEEPIDVQEYESQGRMAGSAFSVVLGGEIQVELFTFLSYIINFLSK